MSTGQVQRTSGRKCPAHGTPKVSQTNPVIVSQRETCRLKENTEGKVPVFTCWHHMIKGLKFEFNRQVLSLDSPVSKTFKCDLKPEGPSPLMQ